MVGSWDTMVLQVLRPVVAVLCTFWVHAFKTLSLLHCTDQTAHRGFERLPRILSSTAPCNKIIATIEKKELWAMKTCLTCGENAESIWGKTKCDLVCNLCVFLHTLNVLGRYSSHEHLQLFQDWPFVFPLSFYCFFVTVFDILSSNVRLVSLLLYLFSLSCCGDVVRSGFHYMPLDSLSLSRTSWTSHINQFRHKIGFAPENCTTRREARWVPFNPVSFVKRAVSGSRCKRVCNIQDILIMFNL